MADEAGGSSSMTVSVAFALPRRQTELEIEVLPGTTAGEAVERSGLRILYPELATLPLQLAIFGRLVTPETALKPGDRVELLRALPNDPKEARRRLAAKGQTMGRNPRGES